MINKFKHVSLFEVVLVWSYNQFSVDSCNMIAKMRLRNLKDAPQSFQRAVRYYLPIGNCYIIVIIVIDVLYCRVGNTKLYSYHINYLL